MTDRTLLQQALEALLYYAAFESMLGRKPERVERVEQVVSAIRARLAEPDDTDARVQRIMEAADEFGHAQVIAATASRLPDEAAHAKLERVVREVV